MIKTVFDKLQIQFATAEIANSISCDYRNKKPLLICVLKGAYRFMNHMIDDLRVEHDTDFIMVKSYEGESSTKHIQLVLDIDKEIVKGRDVIIVDDIYDTGTTMSWLVSHIDKKLPKSIRICVLINKTGRRTTVMPIDYYGFNLKDKFVIGYGMDYNGEHRGLPYIGELIDESC